MLTLVARIALAAALFSSCANVWREERSGPNALSDAERAGGWRLLFDGETTHGWRGYGRADVPAGWQVVDGALTRVADASRGGAALGAGDIVAVESFQDFVLELEWKISSGGNSGIMFHVGEDHEYPWETGPEYQVLDDAAHRDGLDPRTAAGANYAMHAPRRDVTKPAGEWNQARIEVRGPHVKHWLNGELLLEYDLWSDDWKKRVAASKWASRPDYGLRKGGLIALQDHGDWVAYRSIKIRPLDRG